MPPALVETGVDTHTDTHTHTAAERRTLALKRKRSSRQRWYYLGSRKYPETDFSGNNAVDSIGIT